jgi:membrane protease YdiL (CAAX protease family)
MRERTISANGRVLHGTAFTLLWAVAILIPALRAWPWIWVTPFVAYFALVALLPPLRRSFDWLHVGRITPSSLAVTSLLILVTVSVLVIFQRKFHPDPRVFGSGLPFDSLGVVFLSAVSFAVVNSILEELVFRGIMFDALESQWGVVFSILVTAIAFGIGHLHGYPPGVPGAILAGVYGLALGGLRVWTGGLALPILAHIGADTTIYLLLARPSV